MPLNFCCFSFLSLKAATQVDNAVLPPPPAKTEATDIMTKVEETLDVIGAEVGDAIAETADVWRVGCCWYKSNIILLFRGYHYETYLQLCNIKYN